MVKNMPVNAGATEDKGWIPELGRSPGKTNGNPLHYSCRDDPMDIGYSPWCHKESDMIQHAEASKHSSMLPFILLFPMLYRNI